MLFRLRFVLTVHGFHLHNDAVHAYDAYLCAYGQIVCPVGLRLPVVAIKLYTAIASCLNCLRHLAHSTYDSLCIAKAFVASTMYQRHKVRTQKDYGQHAEYGKHYYLHPQRHGKYRHNQRYQCTNAEACDLNVARRHLHNEADHCHYSP